MVVAFLESVARWAETSAESSGLCLSTLCFSLKAFLPLPAQTIVFFRSLIFSCVCYLFVLAQSFSNGFRRSHSSLMSDIEQLYFPSVYTLSYLNSPYPFVYEPVNLKP